MKNILFVILSLFTFMAQADAVRWGGASFSNGEVDVFLPPDIYGTANGATLVWPSPEDGLGNYEQPSYYLHGDFSVTTTGDTTTIKGVNHVAAYSTVFVRMDVGDTVNLLTTFYANEVFYAFGWRPGEEELAETHRYSGDYDITVPSYGTQQFYLGFGVEGYDESAVNDENPFGYAWLYGWLEIAVNGTELSIVNSAIGLNGQSMTVGQIPEPSAMALLLLGIATLALRRRLAPSTSIV